MSLHDSGNHSSHLQVLWGFFVVEKDCWCCSSGFASLLELPHEHLTEDDVRRVLEDGREDDGDPV